MKLKPVSVQQSSLENVCYIYGQVAFKLKTASFKAKQLCK